MSPITLYSQGTPNGHVASILLEELKDAYGGPDYEVVTMSIWDADIGKIRNQVKSEWYLKINPNGRIPAIVDNGVSVFETSAILLYLAQKYDKDHLFSYDPATNIEGWSEDNQWIFWTHSGIGEMQVQYKHFKQVAPEKNPYAINRYYTETLRLYGILEGRLKDRDYLTGPGRGRFGIADIKTFLWGAKAESYELPLAEKFPNVKAWVERVLERPAIKRGMSIPN